MKNIIVSKGLNLTSKTIEELSELIKNDAINVLDVEGFVIVNDTPDVQRICVAPKNPLAAIKQLSRAEDGGWIIDEGEVEAVIDTRGATFEESISDLVNLPYTRITGFVTVR